MKSNIDILKGIHPGRIIGKELKNKHLSQRSFAAAIGEHSQTINAVITGRRNMTTELSLKIEKSLGYSEGFLLTLQAYHDIAEYKRQSASKSVSGAPRINKAIFWDSDFDKMDWGRYKTAVLQRIMERGNNEDKKEIARFYGISISDIDNYRPTNAYRIRVNQTHK